MNKTYLILGVLAALLAVILGAFGAHGLRPQLSSDHIRVFETGVTYQYYHAFALLFCGVLAHFIESPYLKIAAYLFLGGIILFSGSLYLLSTRELIGLTNYKWLGPITPIGGLCFIGGWLSLLWVVFSKID